MQAKSNNEDLSTSLQGITNPRGRPTGPNNSLASVQVQNGLLYGQDNESRRASRDVPALVYRPKGNADNEMEQPLFSEPHELSLLDQNQNHTSKQTFYGIVNINVYTVVELTEENFVTDRKAPEFLRIKVNIMLKYIFNEV